MKTRSETDCQEKRLVTSAPCSRNSGAPTQVIMAINVFMFMVEICPGQQHRSGRLVPLGRIIPAGSPRSEWWRLILSLFLHFGPLHLAMNMLGLWLLGPFTEFALGSRRFVLVYLLAGIGSMTTVLVCSSGAQEVSLTVGASGCVMGLVGAVGSPDASRMVAGKSPGRQTPIGGYAHDRVGSNLAIP